MDSEMGGLELFHHFDEDINGRAEVVRSSGATVQAVGDRVQIGMTLHGQIGALRQVLTQQAVGVLADPALPGAVRVAEVNIDAGPIGSERRLRLYIAQQCFGWSNEGIEDAVHDSPAIRHFVGIDLGPATTRHALWGWCALRAAR